MGCGGSSTNLSHSSCFIALPVVRCHSKCDSSYDDTALLLSEISDVVYSRQLVDIIVALICLYLNCIYGLFESCCRKCAVPAAVLVHYFPLF